MALLWGVALLQTGDIGGVAKSIQRKLDQVHTEIVTLIAQLKSEQTTLRSDKTAEARQRLPRLEKELTYLEALAGLRIKLMGEYSRMNESFKSLGFRLALAALLVYLLLVALFRSFVGPFIIMFTVPLGLIGVLTMLFVTRTTLNIQSQMGVIFLVGIAVNNGVLLVDFANKQRKLGATVQEAITTAAAIRFRPILMTFLATFLDLIPMAIGLGRGSEWLFEPGNAAVVLAVEQVGAVRGAGSPRH